METKDIIKYAAIAVGAYYVYTMFIAPATATATPSPAPAPTPTGTSPTNQFPVNPAKPPTGGSDPLPTQPNPPPPPPPPTGNNSTFTSPDYGTLAWTQRVMALMNAAAGNSHPTLDDWSYYYQNQAGGSMISAALMQSVIDQLGGDRARQVPADTFLAVLRQGKDSGISGVLSGLGMYGFGLGAN